MTVTFSPAQMFVAMQMQSAGVSVSPIARELMMFPAAVKLGLVSLTQYGLCVQPETPTPDAPVDIICNNGPLRWDSTAQLVRGAGPTEVIRMRSLTEDSPALFAEDLLSVGETEDMQTITSGEVYRQIGACIFTGGADEAWEYDSRYHRFSCTVPGVKNAATVRRLQSICTHYVCKYNGESISTIQPGEYYSFGTMAYFHDSHLSVNSWRAWLADQLAAGHPLMLVYPLEDADYQTVEPQAIEMLTDPSMLCISAAVSGIKIEAGFDGLTQQGG